MAEEIYALVYVALSDFGIESLRVWWVDVDLG